MAVITGWYALGTGISNLGVFQEATTYTREAVNFTGTALSGLTQSITQITGPTGPVGGVLYKGAIFDALTGGNCLMYWDWTTLTDVPNNFLAVTGNLIFNSYVSTALNLSSQGGSGASGASLDAGAQIGTFNGQPVIAAQRLQIQGGSLVAIGTSKIEELAGATKYWQNNGTNIANLDTSGDFTASGNLSAAGNVSLTGTTSSITTTGKLTVAGGGVDLLITVGGVAVASIGTAGNLILKGTVAASGTPA